MVGEKLLTKMFEYAKNIFSQYGMTYHFAMQTNLTKLNDEYVKLFNKYNINVGFSFDGINKKSNAKRSKNLTDKFFIDKVKLMTDNNVSCGPLMVLNDANKDHVLKSINYIDKKLNKHMKINYAEDVNPQATSDSEVPGKEFFEKNYKVVINNFIKTGKLYESNLNEIFNKYFVSRLAIHKKTASMGNCNVKLCGGGLRIIEIEPNGKVYYCGRYNKEYDETFIQNAEDKDFLSMHQIKRHMDFAIEKHTAILDTGCDTCRAEAVCDYGCMAFHYSKFGTWGIRKDLVCEIYKPLYDYLVENENEIIKAFIKAKQSTTLSFNTNADIVDVNDSDFSKYINKLGYKIHAKDKSINLVKM